MKIDQNKIKQKVELASELAEMSEGLCHVLVDAAQMNCSENGHMIYGLENLQQEISKLCDILDELVLEFVDI